MRSSFAQIRIPLLALVLASTVGACASLPPPTGEVSAAQQAVAKADSADADQYAAQELTAARSELAQAQAALAAGDEDDARRLALAATADADLAFARSRAAQTRTELQQRRDEIASLRQRLRLDPEPPRTAALDSDVAVGGDPAVRLQTLATDPVLRPYAVYERLQAQQAVDAWVSARNRDRENAFFLATRRVDAAELAARIEAGQREIDQLDRERSELLVEASRREAESARAEAERLRIQAQIQAEETERLRAQTAADAQAMQNIDAALQGATGAQAAKLSAAREKEAALARQEAELLAGGKLPPSRRDARGEVFTLETPFVNDKASLKPAATTSLRTLAIYLTAGPPPSIRIEAAPGKLSQQRANAVRDALIKAGVPKSRIEAVAATGKAANRVEVIALAR